MGNIVISENVSLDGVIQDPTGTDGFKLGGWFNQLSAADRDAWATVEFDEARSAGALLMGRRTYEWFLAQGWPARRGAWADRLRSLPKYVASSTLKDPEWINSTILNGDIVTEVSKLARHVSADVVVYGSGRLVNALTAHDLVDELRLMICPLVLGEGERLFGEGSNSRLLRLIGTRSVGDSLVQLTYQTRRNPAR